jgi:hypothetical protein
MAIVGYSAGEWLLGVVFWGGLIGGIVAYIKYKRAKEEEARQTLTAAFRGVGATGYRDFGSYVGGLPNSPTPGGMSGAKVGPQFVFLYTDSGVEAGWIATSSITSVRVMDESTVQQHVQTLQRVTATRLALVGVFALAAPKRSTTTTTTVSPKYVLLVEWSGTGGLQEATAFQFSSASEANGAADYLRQGRLAQMEPETSDADTAPTSLLQGHCPKCGTAVNGEFLGEQHLSCPECSSRLIGLQCPGCGKIKVITGLTRRGTPARGMQCNCGNWVLIPRARRVAR